MSASANWPEFIKMVPADLLPSKKKFRKYNDTVFITCLHATAAVYLLSTIETHSAHLFES